MKTVTFYPEIKGDDWRHSVPLTCAHARMLLDCAEVNKHNPGGRLQILGWQLQDGVRRLVVNAYTNDEAECARIESLATTLLLLR